MDFSKIDLSYNQDLAREIILKASKENLKVVVILKSLGMRLLRPERGRFFIIFIL